MLSARQLLSRRTGPELLPFNWPYGYHGNQLLLTKKKKKIEGNFFSFLSVPWCVLLYSKSSKWRWRSLSFSFKQILSPCETPSPAGPSHNRRTWPDSWSGPYKWVIFSRVRQNQSETGKSFQNESVRLVPIIAFQADAFTKSTFSFNV